MFMKLFVVCCVLYTVQVLAGPIKPPMSANCQDLEDEIELANFKMRQMFSRSEMSYKELEKSSENKIKLSLKQLKAAIKSGKGTTCGDGAALEQKPLETKFKQEIKLCKTKVNFKELQKSANTYLKELRGHASMIDKYCAFICENEESIPNCVDESVSECQASLDTFENKINQGLAQREKQINDCYHNLTDSISDRSLTLQNDIQTCMEAANDEESGSNSGSESDESGSNEESKETTTVAKDDDDENHSGEDNDNPEATTTEAAIEDGDNGEDGKDQEGDGEDNENNPNKGDNDGEEGGNEEATTVDNSHDDTTEGDAGNHEVEEGTTVGNNNGEVEVTTVAQDDNNNNGEESGDGQEPEEGTNNNEEIPDENNDNNEEVPTAGSDKQEGGEEEIPNEENKGDGENAATSHSNGEEDEVNIEY